MTDNEIIENLQHNRYAKALNGLYDLMPAVKKYVKANNGSASDAADIFQDALVILCKKVGEGNFQLTAPLKVYLMAVVKNCWLQELRLRKKIPAGEMTDETPADVATEEALFVYAKNAFGNLGEKCRQLLILFYFKKQSFETIAPAMGFSDPKIAKNQKYRCLQKAKEHYALLLKSGPHE